MSIKILITGATGFIGSELVQELVRRKYKVRCLCRKNSYIEKLKNLPVEIFYGDITDRKSLDDAVNNIDIVIHLAAILKIDKHDSSADHDRIFNDVNVNGTRNLLSAAEKFNVKKFIHISTMAVFNVFREGKINPIPSMHPDVYAYAMSKYEAEQAVMSSKVSYTILRFPYIWDWNRLGRRFNVMVWMIRKFRIVIVPSEKRNEYVSMITLNHLCDRIVRAIESSERNKIYSIEGDRIIYKDLIRKIANHYKIYKFSIIYIPNAFASSAGNIAKIFFKNSRESKPKE